MDTQQNKTVLVIGGYANSGKTTAIKYLEDTYGAKVSSGSRMLHHIVENLILDIFQKEYDSYDRDNELHTSITSITDCLREDKVNPFYSQRKLTNRELHIEIAENVIRKTFGIDTFAKLCADCLLNKQSDLFSTMTRDKLNSFADLLISTIFGSAIPKGILSVKLTGMFISNGSWTGLTKFISRKALVDRVTDSIKRSFQSISDLSSTQDKLLIFETIGGREYECFTDIWEHLGGSKLTTNIISNYDQKGCDGRVLIPIADFTIFNNRQTSFFVLLDKLYRSYTLRNSI